MARDPLGMQDVTIAEPMNETPHNHLRPSVLSTHSAHYFTALCPRVYVHLPKHNSPERLNGHALDQNGRDALAETLLEIRAAPIYSTPQLYPNEKTFFDHAKPFHAPNAP